MTSHCYCGLKPAWRRTTQLTPVAGLSAVERRAGVGAAGGDGSAWFVLGTLEATVAGLTPGDLFDRAYAHLLTRRRHLLRCSDHTANGGWRAKLPNFATEIYSLLALAETARHGLASKAALTPERWPTSSSSCGFPMGDGRGCFTPTEPSSSSPTRSTPSIRMPWRPWRSSPWPRPSATKRMPVPLSKGFQWCFGRNELHFAFYDPANRFAYRSIKRRGSAHSLNLWANTGLGGLLRVWQLAPGSEAWRSTPRAVLITSGGFSRPGGVASTSMLWCRVRHECH